MSKRSKGRNRRQSGCTFKHIGRCIYCLTTHRPLTDEHVVPHALGGKYVLQEASCEECQRIINQFETEFLRETYGPLRIAHNFPTSKPKATLPIYIVSESGEKRKVDVPKELAVYVIPKIEFERCSILTLKPINTDAIRVRRQNITSTKMQENLAELMETLKPGERIMVPGSIHYQGMMRQLAKIAHASAVWEVGLAGFSPHALVPGILTGDLKCLLANVGCPPLDQSPNSTWEGWNPSALHHGFLRALSVNFRGQTAKLGVLYIKLLSYIDVMPTYEIVVGQLNDDAGEWHVRDLTNSAT